MNIIFWNIRGIGNNDSRIALSDMCRLNRIFSYFSSKPVAQLIASRYVGILFSYLLGRKLLC